MNDFSKLLKWNWALIANEIHQRIPLINLKPLHTLWVWTKLLKRQTNNENSVTVSNQVYTTAWNADRHSSAALSLQCCSTLIWMHRMEMLHATFTYTQRINQTMLQRIKLKLSVTSIIDRKKVFHYCELFSIRASWITCVDFRSPVLCNVMDSYYGLQISC